MKLVLATALLSLAACNPAPSSPSDEARVRAQDSVTPYTVSDANRTKDLDTLAELHKKEIALESEMIAPAQEDLAAYADLLKDPNSGLARLFPSGGDEDRQPLLIDGHGAYYAFLARSNAYGRGSDIGYEDQSEPQLTTTFAGADFGILAPLGKVDLRQVTLDNPIVSYVVNQPSMNGRAEADWRNEERKWASGVDAGGTRFGTRTDAIVGMTYVLRSSLESVSELIVLVQVVRRDPVDQSLILAWKILKTMPTPHMAR